MTITLHRTPTRDTDSWAAMPGWSISADLTPHELREHRQLRLLRRVTAACLLVLVLVCAAGFLLAHRANTAAQDDLDRANARTTAIQASIDRHSAVTRVKAATAGIDGQLATLFTGDVDIPKLVAQVVNANTSLTISSVSVSLAAGTEDTETGTSSIGTVTMSGTSTRLVDLAEYIDRLEGISGITDIIPSSNSAGAGWSLTFQITSARYDTRFSAAAGSTSSAGSAATTSTGGS